VLHHLTGAMQKLPHNAETPLASLHELLENLFETYEVIIGKLIAGMDEEEDICFGMNRDVYGLTPIGYSIEVAHAESGRSGMIHQDHKNASGSGDMNGGIGTTADGMSDDKKTELMRAHLGGLALCYLIGRLPFGYFVRFFDEDIHRLLRLCNYYPARSVMSRSSSNSSSLSRANSSTVLITSPALASSPLIRTSSTSKGSTTGSLSSSSSSSFSSPFVVSRLQCLLPCVLSRVLAESIYNRSPDPDLSYLSLVNDAMTDASWHQFHSSFNNNHLPSVLKSIAFLTKLKHIQTSATPSDLKDGGQLFDEELHNVELIDINASHPKNIIQAVEIESDMCFLIFYSYFKTLKMELKELNDKMRSKLEEERSKLLVFSFVHRLMEFGFSLPHIKQAILHEASTKNNG
jgi:hypothetical protein